MATGTHNRTQKKSAEHRNIVFETEEERTRIMLATHWNFKRLVLSTALVVGVTTAARVVQSHANAVGSFTDRPCCALSTKRIEIAQRQTARFELKNTGDESVAAHLQFVDKEGKTLQQRDATIKPGHTEELAYTPIDQGLHLPEGVETLEFPDAPGHIRAQFTTKQARSISLLRPELRIIDKKSGQTVQVVGPEGFKKFQPAELRSPSGPN
jgi:hypothetical protein